MLAGEAFLHLDVRSDNLCLQEGRVVLVDWNFAHVGNPLLDIGRLAAEPEARRRARPVGTIVPDSQDSQPCWQATSRPAPACRHRLTAPRVREFQRRQAEVALPWAARELRLPPP